jgi:disulfide bond formation protein DsbB
LLLYGLTIILFVSYIEEFIFKNSPCSLCIVQRFFMVGIGVGLMFNISSAINYKNFVLSLLSCLLGSIVALYQWSQLLINDGVTEAVKILSLPMYIWAAFVFFGYALALFLLLFIFKKEQVKVSNPFIKISFWLFFIVSLSQIFATM